jgi:hypothetical protein
MILVLLLGAGFLKWPGRLDPSTLDGVRHSFGAGFVHGFVMPMALVPLVTAGDVAIYSVNHDGRFYHLGYVAGVNVCGLIFIPQIIGAGGVILDALGRAKK